jgi:hypothetical protein
MQQPYDPTVPLLSERSESICLSKSQHIIFIAISFTIAKNSPDVLQQVDG